jgi:hypothetical protein
MPENRTQLVEELKVINPCPMMIIAAAIESRYSRMEAAKYVLASIKGRAK